MFHRSWSFSSGLLESQSVGEVFGARLDQVKDYSKAKARILSIAKIAKGPCQVLLVPREKK